MPMPPDHPQRFVLNDEVHARPPMAIQSPMRVSYLAFFSDWPLRDQDIQPICDLARRFGVSSPEAGANHFKADLGPFQVKWERHTEFSRYTFLVDGCVPDDPFSDPALNAVPADWIADLPGQIIVASHGAVVPDDGKISDYDALSGVLFGGHALIGADVSDASATLITDFRIHADGFSRFLLRERGMTPRQAGRSVQRLLEIDTYRMMALMALPMARSLTPVLKQHEQELAQVTTAMAAAEERAEPVLLDRLTRLASAIESRHADSHARFSAATAYYDLVRRRISELREERIQSLQTFHEFMERRLAPAMGTCESVAARQESLSRHTGRATQLLMTRVDVMNERQNQAVLTSMNRRAEIQLRLQETVEALSTAAVTYYVVGLIGYAAKGLKQMGVLPISPEIAIALSVPIVAVIVWMGVHRVRKMVVEGKNDNTHPD